MYTTSNLILYIENEDQFSNAIRSAIIECNIPFREIKPPTPISPSIKVCQNIIILQVNSQDFLQEIERRVKFCHNFQNRILAIYPSPDLVDYFFDNYCLSTQLDKIKQFILTNTSSNNITPPNKTATLLKKLISAELENIGISRKYIGFDYLVDISIHSFSKNFYTKDYIDLFHCIACSNFIKVDTIEKSVRHMLIKTWRNSEKFRQTLSFYEKMQRPNSKTILNTLLNYLKKVI